MSTWLTSSVPQGFILRPILFNTYITDIHNGVECNKFADDTKLSGVANTPVGRDAIQTDLGRLEEWVHVNVMKFNKAKCKVVHMIWGNPQYQSRLGYDWL